MYDMGARFAPAPERARDRATGAAHGARRDSRQRGRKTRLRMERTRLQVPAARALRGEGG